jgi:hypothetical protein
LTYLVQVEQKPFSKTNYADGQPRKKKGLEVVVVKKRANSSYVRAVDLYATPKPFLERLENTLSYEYPSFCAKQEPPISILEC